MDDVETERYAGLLEAWLNARVTTSNWIRAILSDPDRPGPTSGQLAAMDALRHAEREAHRQLAEWMTAHGMTPPAG